MWAKQVNRPARRALVGEPHAPSPTSIDRRKCHRVVPMEVLGLGLSRTGTSSLRQALIDLGYDDCYHFATPLNENPADCTLWSAAMDAKFAGKGKEFGREEWDQLLGHCRAITDTPCVIFYEELLAAYPDARVILTIRDSTEQWYNSACRTIIGNWIDVYIAPPATLWGRLQRLFKPLTPVDQMCRRLHKYCMHGFMYKRGKQFYEEYNAVIQRIVPQENLLVFNVKQGWEPLCKFLGKEIPPWEFPRGNDTETFLANMAPIHSYNHWIVMRRMWRTVGLVAAAMACLWAWLWK